MAQAQAQTGGSIRIAGVVIPNKHIDVALTSIFGIGRRTAINICDECGITPSTKARQLTSDDLEKLRGFIAANHVVEGDLRREVMMNKKHLQDIKCYRGLRHRRNLPVRGQNTKNNARTRKGKRRLVTK